MDIKELGNQVLQRRRALGLSQEALATKADISRNYISLIERGEAHNVSVNVVNQLANALGATPAELLGQSKDDAFLISPSLRRFAIEDNLSYDVVDRLARIPRRGQEPKTVEQWRQLFSHIRQYLEDD